MGALSEIAVTTLKIAPIRDLNLEITERWDRRRVRERFPLGRGFRISDQVFRETESEEFLILIRKARTLPLAALKEKLEGILAQFVEVVFFNIVKTGFFKTFQSGMRRQNDPSIP